MNEVRIKGVGRDFARLFPPEFPPQLNGRLAESDWAVFIAMLNEAGTIAQTDDLWFGSCLFVCCACCFVLLAMVACVVQPRPSRFFALTCTVVLFDVLFIVYIHFKLCTIESTYIDTVKRILCLWNATRRFKRAAIFADIDFTFAGKYATILHGWFDRRLDKGVLKKDTYYLLIVIQPRVTIPDMPATPRIPAVPPRLRCITHQLRARVTHRYARPRKC